MALAGRLAGVQSQRARWGLDEALLATTIGPGWRGEATDFAAAVRIARWTAAAATAPIRATPDRILGVAATPGRAVALRDAIAGADRPVRAVADELARALGPDHGLLPLERDLTEVAARLQLIADQADRYADWAEYRRHRTALDAAGLGALAARVESGGLGAAAAVVELRFARAERIWRDCITSSPALAAITRTDRDGLVATFGRLERDRLVDNVAAILAGHLTQLPQGAEGEMGVIRGEIGKKRGHLALRRLFAAGPAAMQRIKPVLLMSPISVAQFLPRDCSGSTCW